MIDYERFRSVAEDLEWFRREWWEAPDDQLSTGHIRRGSTTLHLLLVQGLVQRVWKACGFSRQPKILAPDVEAYARENGIRLDLTVGMVAGGGRQNGLDVALFGAYRIDHPETGVPAEAEEGFAVKVNSVVRRAVDAPAEGDLVKFVERPWPISEYLESIGAIRRGQIITRREVIAYFRNYAGGAHHDLSKSSRRKSTERHELIAELERHVTADVRDGLHFELLSMGQAVGRSPDLHALESAIRHGLESPS